MAVLLVAAFALVFGSGMVLLEAVEDRSAGLLWVGMGLFSALKKTPLKQKGAMHPAVKDRIEAIDRISLLA